jgi:hypothetical protein
MAPNPSPQLKFLRVEDFEPLEVKAQQHGERRAGVHLRFLEQTPTRAFNYCQYDPAMTLEAHGHVSDHAIFIVKGSLRVGDVLCGPRTLVVLERGAVFGPLVAGPEGTELLEFYAGESTPVPADPDGFAALLQQRGITPVPARDLRS